MISISTTTFNETGNVIIHESGNSKLNDKEARVSRSATLDGGVYINHSGFAVGDRTLGVRSSRISLIDTAVLTMIFEQYTTVLIALHDGLYLGTISKMTAENGHLKMTILLEQKEN